MEEGLRGGENAESVHVTKGGRVGKRGTETEEAASPLPL